MTVEFEPNQARRSFRYATPVRVRLVAGEHAVIDWSFEGFRVGGLDTEQPLYPGETVWAELVFAFPDSDVVVQCTGIVSWTDDDEAGIRFVELPPSARDTMRLHLDRYGPLANLPDSRARLDAVQTNPITRHGHVTEPQIPGERLSRPAPGPGLIRYQPARPPMVRTVPHQARPVPMWTRLLVYVALGLAALVLAVTLWRSQARVTSVHAQVAGQTVEMASPAAGVVQAMYVTPGDIVGPGEVLFQIDSDLLRSEVEALERLVELKQRVVAQTEQLIEEEADSSDFRVEIAESRARSARMRRDQVRAELRYAKIELDRIAPLVERGMLPRAEADLSRARVAELQAQAGAAGSEFAEANVVLDRAREGYFFTGSREQGAMSSLEGMLAERQADLVEQQLALEGLRSRLSDAKVVTRRGGQVVALLALEGQEVQRAQPVVTLSTSGRRWVSAQFAVSEVRLFALGDEARVYIPAEDLLLDGVVEAFEERSTTSSPAVPVRIRLLDPPPDLGIGMGAEATVKVGLKLGLGRGRIRTDG
jgi:multidrug resistance efflux pump